MHLRVSTSRVNIQKMHIRIKKLLPQNSIPLLIGEATEQASAALFLASDESSFITGTDFKVDGDICAAYVVCT
jgi:NAD(P)-dependent dehydrogenase (short-subunit alcohol dehydrogenase family)